MSDAREDRFELWPERPEEEVPRRPRAEPKPAPLPPGTSSEIALVIAEIRALRQKVEDVEERLELLHRGAQRTMVEVTRFRALLEEGDEPGTRRGAT